MCVNQDFVTIMTMVTANYCLHGHDYYAMARVILIEKWWGTVLILSSHSYCGPAFFPVRDPIKASVLFFFSKQSIAVWSIQNLKCRPLRCNNFIPQMNFECSPWNNRRMLCLVADKKLNDWNSSTYELYLLKIPPEHWKLFNAHSQVSMFMQ